MDSNEKILYISDLDGTLLNAEEKISEYSREKLNKPIDKEINFSIATARTPATVVELLEDTYYLEIYQSDVSKAQAIKAVKVEYGFDKVVCFGDNLNDIPMFELSDEGYAVENAKEEVKQIATGIIGGNDKDGVVKFLSKINVKTY
ncbi:MAG: HAD hydrolase family protein [Cellulosilyticaceae bacterium]